MGTGGREVSIQPKEELPKHLNWPTKGWAALGRSCPECSEANGHTQNHMPPQRPRVLGAGTCYLLELPRVSVHSLFSAVPVAPDTSASFLGFLCLIREAPLQRSDRPRGEGMGLIRDAPFPAIPTVFQPGPPLRHRKELATYPPRLPSPFLQYGQALNHDVGTSVISAIFTSKELQFPSAIK